MIHTILYLNLFNVEDTPSSLPFPHPTVSHHPHSPLEFIQSLHNPSTSWVATDPTFTHKSTQFLFHVSSIHIVLVSCVSFTPYVKH
jgi:hypothetical protein